MAFSQASTVAASKFPWPRALFGLACAAPFLILNALVANGHGPTRQFFAGVISDHMFRTNPLGSVVFLASMALIAVGGLVLLKTAFARHADGRRQVLWLPLALGSLMLVGFVTLSGVFGHEVYECEILGTKVCD